jgi:hypothetical protein
MAQVYKRFNLAVVTRKYTGNDGVEKSNWERIGQMTTFKKDDGSYSSIIELYHMPGTTISVFENKPKEQPAPQPTAQHEPTEDIQIEDIPF